MAEADWEAKAKFMRAHGAVTGVWDEAGRLIHLTLAALSTPGPAAQMAAFHDRNQAAIKEAAAKKAIERQHAVLFAASSVRPNLNTPASPPNAVPRAVAAKEAAKRRGQQG